MSGVREGARSLTVHGALVGRGISGNLSLKLRCGSESSRWRPSTIVIVTDIPRTQSGRCLQRPADKARVWSFMAEPGRILAAVCDVLYIDEADLIDGETDLRASSSVRFVLLMKQLGVNRQSSAVPVGREPSIAGWLRELVSSD